MKDGLYQVTTPFLCAGFVVEDGRVTECAPILRKRLDAYLSKAFYVDPMAQKQSLGGGYGINRKAGGQGVLGIAVPPLKSVTVHPGVGKVHHKNVNYSRKAK